MLLVVLLFCFSRFFCIVVSFFFVSFCTCIFCFCKYVRWFLEFMIRSHFVTLGCEYTIIERTKIDFKFSTIDKIYIDDSD